MPNAQYPMPKSPPYLAQRLLLRFLRSDLAEEVSGDLNEKFYATVKNKSLFRAKLNYWYQVLNYLRPFAIRRSKLYHINQTAMFQNYFKIAWRNLLKNKGYSAINICGLGIGMAVAMIIGLWIHDELSFNHYFRNYDRIGHVMTHQDEDTYPSNPIPLATELRTAFADDLEYVVMSSWKQEWVVAYGDKNFFQSGSFMQPDAPEMLSLEMISGSRSALKDKNSILLSESLAKKLFGYDDPVDKIIRIKNMVDIKVAGVYKDLPHNTEFHDLTFIAPWDFLVSWMTWMKEQETRWDDNSYKIYVQLTDIADFDKVSSRIKDLKLKHLGNKADGNPQLFIHPMSNWHLYSKFENRKEVTSQQLEFIWLYGTIGTFVLVLACINFMNLSTARSEKRAREVGIRKTMGSLRKQLISQFFSESFLTAALALTLAILLVQMSLPWFNSIAGKQISILWSSSVFWFAVAGFVTVTGLMAGSYPALYLSSFDPVKVLKGTFRAGRFASLPRKVLVVLQFTVSITLIIGTIIVFKQIQLAKNRPVGYDRNGLMTVYMVTPELYRHYEVIRNELLASGIVDQVATSSGPATEIWNNNSGFDWKGKDPNMETNFVTARVTHDYGKTIGWQFTKGRDFSAQIASDSMAIVVNESAVKYMGLENPVDETIQWNRNRYRVVGVIKDMVMGSPFEPVQPTLFIMDYNNIYTINIRINQGINAGYAVSKIEDVFRKYNPAVPFEYKFADVEFAKKFRGEERVGTLASVFATLAILISCLGLFGLAAFVAERRAKEIGIRKVVGASVLNLWGMLSREFVWLVLLSCAIASPVAYFVLSSWLENYSYRTEISWWIFAASSLGALLVILVTVSYQALKAATMNPVESLRSE